MDTGQILHIIVTVIAILGAAAVALVCDILKSSNERLRQTNLELEIRRGEERRRTQMALEQLQRVQATAERALAVASASRAELPPAPESPARRTPLLAALAPAGSEPVQSDPAAPAAPVSSGVDTGFIPPPLAGPIPSFAEAFAARGPSRNWEAILRSAPRRRPAALADAAASGHRLRGELIPFKLLQGTSDTFQLPGGFHPFAAFAHLLENRGAFQGLVLAIGLNSPGQEMSVDPLADDERIEQVEAYLRALLQPFEFCSWIGHGRFVVVTPDRESAAQRRFDDLLGKLWSYQPRGGPTGRESFYCGGFEADGQPLADAVAAAVSHMDANRDTNMPPHLETPRHRLAV